MDKANENNSSSLDNNSTELANDSISRQAAIDALNLQLSDWNCDYNVPVCDCIEIIERLPSAQPEIVRCKDCKFANSLKIGIVCRNMSHSVTENDFCSRAERRTNGVDY